MKIIHTQIRRRNRRKRINKTSTFTSTSPISISPDQILVNSRNDAWSDKTDPASNQHRRVKQKKKKFSPLCKLLSTVVIFLSIILFVIILLFFLLRRKTAPIEISLHWNSTGITVVGVTGQNGTSPNHLRLPFGLTFDYKNTLYVADYGNSRIQMFSSDFSIGTTIAGFPNATQVHGNNGFHYATDIIVDSDDNMYIADFGNNRVQLWTKNASYGTKIAGFGGPGPGLNQLNQPYCVARDSNSKTLYISEGGTNNRIMVYEFNASSGTILVGGQGVGTNSTQLNTPMGLYFDSLSNSLIIANCYANNIVRSRLNTSNWELVVGNINGSYGYTSSELWYPQDVTLDPMGNIYVADTGNQRIQFFSVGQSNGITVAGITGTTGNTSTLLKSPYGVTLDNQLNLYVSDSANHRIQKFQRY